MRQTPAITQAVRCGGPRCIRDTAGIERHLRRLDAHRTRALSVMERQGFRGEPDAVSGGRAASAPRNDTDCGCEGEQRKPTPTKPDRQVRGEALAQLLKLGEDLALELRGVEVQVEDEAWSAVQASVSTRTAWNTTRRKVARRRAAIWPEARARRTPSTGERTDGTRSVDSSARAVSINEGVFAPCDCAEVFSADTRWISGARYVDATLGDDANSGGATLSFDPTAGKYALKLHPWKSLRRVEHWLNVELWEGRRRELGACVEGAEVYLRRGRTWDGSEEPYDLISDWADAPDSPFDWAAPEPDELRVEAILSIRGFRATEASPLILSCYPPPATAGGLPGPLRDSFPLIDGVERSIHGALYGDKRTGIFFLSCCHVYVSHLRIRGFEVGLSTGGASKNHLYQNLTVYDCAGAGIGFGIGETMAATYYGFDTNQTISSLLDLLFQEMVDDGFYPEDIVVDTCNLYSIGYDTGGQDIAIGFLSSNCTVTGCTMTGDEVRGVDGVLFNGASSGHLIEKNRISVHNKFCRTDSTCKAGFVVGLTGPTLVHPCSELSPGGAYPGIAIVTPYGYTQRYHQGCPTPDNNSAFGEDGIDMKGVRIRTPTAKISTHVCDNVIWGHGTFTGIAVSDSSQNIHIYRNRIFRNGTGIAVANGDSKPWFNYGRYFERPVARVYIYRNLIYMNLGQGIQVASSYEEVRAGLNMGTMTTFGVYGVYIIGNTIAHNLLEGVKLSPAYGEGIEGVFLFNNLIARNLDPYNRTTEAQVQWSASTPPSPVSFWSDFNCYLGWDNSSATSPSEKVIRIGGWDGPVADAVTTWGIEPHGRQATFLGELYLEDYAAIEAVEGIYDDPVTFVRYWGIDIGNNIKTFLSSSAIESLTYAMGTDSLCLNAGTAYPSLHAGATDVTMDELSISPDIEGASVRDGTPDVGAYETQ